MTAVSYRILLVEDDPDDRLLVEELIAEIDMWRADLVTASTYDEGVARALEGGFDIALVDYRLGARRGMEFISEPAVRRADIPVVILDGQGGSEADLAAAQAGAADFLSKADLSSALLERTIRYTVEDRRRHQQLVHTEYRVAHRDGTWRHLDTVAQNLLHDPLVHGIVVNSRDVTELRESQERTRFQAELVHCVGQPVMAVDDLGKVTYWNGGDRRADWLLCERGHGQRGR